jgi:hypothetical protein
MASEIPNPNERYGRTAPGVTNILPELVFDFAADKEQPSTFVKNETPVHPVPELTCA